VLRTQRAPPALHLLVTVDPLVYGHNGLCLLDSLQRQLRQAYAGVGKHADLLAEAAAAAAGEAHGSPATPQPARTHLQGCSASFVSMNTCYCMAGACASQASSICSLTCCCCWCCREVESIQGIRPEIQQAIAAAVNNCVTETNLPLPNKRVVSGSKLGTLCSCDCYSCSMLRSYCKEASGQKLVSSSGHCYASVNTTDQCNGTVHATERLAHTAVSGVCAPRWVGAAGWQYPGASNQQQTVS
jgi:hypothetical protein